VELTTKTVKYHTITLTDEEAGSIAGVLHGVQARFRVDPTPASNELLNWLGSRNEVNPSGEDGSPKS
jgi:hypothetical protein